MSHSLGGASLITNMGVMENNLLNNNPSTNCGGLSTGATTTPSSLSPDLPVSESSESCPSPMSHSPPDSSLNNLISSNNSNNNQLIQSPQFKQERSDSPSNSTSSSISNKSNLNSTPTRTQFQSHAADTTLTNELVNGAGASGSSPKSNQDEDNFNNNNNEAGNNSSDDYDEIKVYNEEGAAEEEQRDEDDLKEEKTEIIKQTIEEKTSPSNPFSINNLMNYNGLAAAAGGKNNAAVNPFGTNPFAAAAAFGALNQQRASLFNPAALYSQELANHFASWWPAAAAGATAFNPYNSSAFNPFNAFNAAAAANYQQQAAAAAVFQAAAASRFSPSLFLPPPSGSNGLSSPKVEPTSHSASSSASSTSSTASSSSSSSAFSSSNQNILPTSPFSGSSSSNSSRFNGNNQHQNISSPHRNNMDRDHTFKHSAKKSKNYENNYPSSMQSIMNKHQDHHGMNHQGMHQMNNPLHQNQQNHHYKQEHLAAPVPHVIVKEKSKKPHVKKPLNAFMLFMKEQRAAVVADCTLRESAAINQILGRKWHELERTEQAKYYEKARLERLEHMKNNPGWSARDNYGLKKKRRRKREKVIGENGELPRKCRARYGLHQLHLWCKPCRRKKKCIRFATEDTSNSQVAQQNNQMYNGMSNMEPGSGGSMNGGNSEDDYDNYEDDSDETDDETDDENDDGQYHQSPKPNKHPHLMNPHTGAGNLSVPPFNLAPNHQANLMQNHYQQQMHQHQQNQHHQQFQQMQNSHLLNNHLLKQMGVGGMPGSGQIDKKSILH